MPLPRAFQFCPPPPLHPLRWGEESQKLPIIALCLSTVHPLCAVIISVFEALMAALLLKIITGPIIFNELHQEVSMGLLALEQRHIGKRHCFLVIKMAVSSCEAQERPFSFSALLNLKGPRKAVWKETSLAPHRVPCAVARCIDKQFSSYRIDKFSKVKPALPLISCL